ncbi:MAG TPA: phospholipid carrier-dependent glycosyltransferase [Anaerolineae bacterium]|nr:phospholipid carrier-dependent glycosyltransferase [Anaerolineae bacterium]
MMTNERWAGLTRWSAVAGLLVFFGLGLVTAVSQAPTVDEYMHIFRGRTLWQTGGLQFQAGHTPLAHWLIGSLLNSDNTLSRVTDLPSWGAGDRFTLAREFFWENAAPPRVERVMFLARLPVLFAGLLTGALLMRWLRLFNRWCGWNNYGPALALIALFAFSPNLLASFTLATTDGLLVTLYVATVFALWWYGQRPSWRRWLLLALFLGLALATKLTALVLLPVLGLLCLWQWYQTGVLFDWRQWPRFVGMWLVLLLGAGLVFWAVYLFELRPLPGIPFPVPAATYAGSFLRVQSHVDQGHVSYLLGELSEKGWWYYFVVTVLVKTPASVLILAAITVVVLMWRRRWLASIYFWLPPLLLFAAASVSRLNIGYRHILPILPFLWLLVAASVPFWTRSRWAKMTLGLLLLAYAMGALRQQPHFLAYFNEFVGGSVNGLRYLGDSNLDWGQDINAVADYVKQTGVDEVFISYYGSGDWQYYGFDKLIWLYEDGTLDYLHPANPVPGLYTVSISHLQGLGLQDPGLLDWFRRQEPVARIGYSVNIYEVPERDEGNWIAYCLDPTPLLEQETAVTLTGQPDVRHVYFDCTNNWVIPNGGAGWYVLPQREAADWLVGRAYPDNFRLVFRHDPGLLEPSYDIVYYDGGAALPSGQTGQLAEETVTLPVVVGDTVVLAGYQQDGSDWWTIWQAQKTPEMPLTVAGHLYAEAPPPIVSDGLGFTGEQWEAGDVIWQRHEFDLGADSRYLETGLYNYLTNERLPFILNGQEIEAFVRLMPIDSR